ncbi:hypothetical protein TgHK011_006714 [Trichoderma gracile]|nr:hypothetical protein TgHK011_006714 [Trichoderma gracile]
MGNGGELAMPPSNGSTLPHNKDDRWKRLRSEVTPNIKDSKHYDLPAFQALRDTRSQKSPVGITFLYGSKKTCLYPTDEWPEPYFNSRVLEPPHFSQPDSSLQTAMTCE